jgi:hypothetical protein
MAQPGRGHRPTTFAAVRKLSQRSLVSPVKTAWGSGSVGYPITRAHKKLTYLRAIKFVALPSLPPPAALTAA